MQDIKMEDLGFDEETKSKQIKKESLDKDSKTFNKQNMNSDLVQINCSKSEVSWFHYLFHFNCNKHFYLTNFVIQNLI